MDRCMSFGVKWDVLEASLFCFLLMGSLPGFLISEALFPHLRKGDDATHRLWKEVDIMR